LTKYIPYNDSLFLSEEWLNAVCDSWKVIRYNDFYIPVSDERKFGFKLCRNFHLTPALPIQDVEIANSLFNHAQKVDLLEMDIRCHPELILKEYSQVIPMRTQILDLNHTIQLNKNRSREINKYATQYRTSMSDAPSRLEDFISKHLKVKKISFTIPSSIIAQVTQYLIKNNKGVILEIYNENLLIATTLLAIDNNTCYNLICASDKQFPGAMTQLMISAIDWAIEQGCSQFDFEGSQDDGVNNFYKSFGTIELAYSRLSVIKNPLLRLTQKITGR
jgi:hypothetical protein